MPSSGHTVTSISKNQWRLLNSVTTNLGWFAAETFKAKNGDPHDMRFPGMGAWQKMTKNFSQQFGQMRLRMIW